MILNANISNLKTNGIFIILLVSFCFFTKGHAQQITVNSSLSVQELVENYLVEGCIEVTNPSSFINGNTIGLASFGSFNSAGSNFPFSDGIVLTTGSAASAGSPIINETLNEGNTTWGTDPDLAALGINNTFNATSIEFDITTVINTIQFNFVLASEEYSQRNLCNEADSFVFLIKETGSADPYTNVAVVSGTTTPVSTNSIHAEIFGFCPAENETYFEGYNLGDTNYDGRTKLLTATATNIIPYVQYHVKLIIAEEFDSNYDTAVFIQGSSLNPTVSLGEDIVTCSDLVDLNGDIGNQQATYAWYFNDNLIAGETSPDLSVDTSGIYTLEVSIPLNGETCIIEDEIEITISSVQNADPIPDFELCDDSSNNGIESFDLSLMDTIVLEAVPTATYTISYHHSLAQAEANTSPITAPITNTSNPQIIYVRLEDTSSGCLAYAPINLVVLTSPTINLTSFSVCDADNDGFAEFDLSSQDAQVIGTQNDILVSYHFTQADADSGDNPIPSPYTNTSTPSEQIFIRLINTLTGCVNTAPFIIDVNGSPTINISDPIYIDACDTDHDGFASFNLTQIINQVTLGLTNVTVTFYETYADADVPQNEIPNPTNYENIVQDVQIVFIRVEDNTTGCASIRSFEIHTNLLLTETFIPEDYHICDIDNDGTEEVLLNNVETAISNMLLNVNITFYLSEDDRDNNINPLDETIPIILTNTNSPFPLYFTLESPTCTENANFNLVLMPIEVFTSISEATYCDTDDDGFTTIDLSSLDSLVNDDTPGFQVLYYLSQTDADNGTNQLPTLYDNISNPFQVYVRIRSNATGCYSTNSFELTVLPAPTVTTPSNFIICDDDQDSITSLNLNSKINEIVTDTNGLNISFHTSLTGAEENNNAIDTPDAYTTTSQTIYVRVENTITNCYAIESFEIQVAPKPVIPTQIENYNICEDDNDQTAEFLLNTKDDEILVGQTGMEVSYHLSLQNAEENTFPIDKDNLYANVASPDIIYFRIENIDNVDCYSTGQFTIQVSPYPIYTAPQNLIVCDSDGSNDGYFQFDFNNVITEINQGSPHTLDLSFYLSEIDATDSTNQLPLLFTNTTPNQQIFVRIENSFECYTIEEFGLNILIIPEVTTALPITECDTNYDGIRTFDLTATDYQILDIRQDNLIIDYYTNLTDLDNQTDPITNPTNFQNTSNPQTVYISVLNTQTNCYAVVPVELISNLPPPIISGVTVEICDNDTDTYTLTETNNLLIADTSTVTISYYENIADAENGTNPLDTNYNYQTNNDTIYVRMVDNTTGCHTTSSFVLQVNPNPIANQPVDLESCDSDYDNIFTFDLSQQTNTVLGTQNPANFTVTYYTSQTDAEAGQNSIDTNLSSATNTIYVRVENNITNCYSITDFDVIVYRKPIVNIPNQVLCLENSPLPISAETGFTTDTYLWSTNATTPEIDITQIGNYSVTITTNFGCTTTASFIVTESEQATIEFTEQVDFADPNNITITVSGIGDYLYSLDNGPAQVSNFFGNVTLGIHTITVIDANGCASISKEIVIIDTPLFMTPNNDGHNDTWHITGVEKLTGTIVYIFDRYGKLLKTLTHSSLGWDGTYNGQNMPTNDYWFLAEVVYNNTEFEVKGHFTLKR